MRKSITLFAASLLFLVGFTASAQNSETYRITFTNMTSQIISPPIVATHSIGTKIFRAGEAPSANLAALAEDADGSGLLDALDANPSVNDWAMGGGVLMPGASMTLDVEAASPASRFSAVGMLVTTNDAFFGIDSQVITGGLWRKVFYANVYDAGSEFNSEDCDFIPGPPCGSGGIRDTGGAEGFVSIHSGIHGIDDLSVAAYDWNNPGVMVTVVRVNP